jgi:2'-5' RNA ligase
MKSSEAPHVSGLEWRFLDADHITLTFLFDAGGKRSREFIQLRRAEK